MSDTKLSTDKFFEKVKVNDDNNDIKNNRLELLQILCSTFNTFVDFSKLEGSWCLNTCLVLETKKQKKY